jgi:hypothetical protein
MLHMILWQEGLKNIVIWRDDRGSELNFLYA